MVDEVRSNLTPQPKFLCKINKTEFISDSHLTLEDTFVFPNLTSDEPRIINHDETELTISELSDLLSHKLVLIYGQEHSGKTALARHLCLNLLAQLKPVLLVEQEHLAGTRGQTFQRAYNDQYQGDYDSWRQQDGKIMILDTSTGTRHVNEVITLAKNIFEQIVVTLTFDEYYTYFKDRMADFLHLRIEPLTFTQQEKLIRKRLALSNGGRNVPDGRVDEVERRVNSIIVSNRIFPRFPFYVLSILQTYEAYMPTDLSITSYGHCYLALITANLVRSEIDNSDNELNVCFNIAEHLAFSIYRHGEDGRQKPFDFESFLTKYKQRFIVKESIVNRMKRPPYGLIDDNGQFRAKYTYYYFLGKYLANGSSHDDVKGVIESMCQNSHREINYLTLLFIIHHTRDTSIIDDILIRTMCTLDSVQEARLNKEETKKFAGLVDQLPEDVMSRHSVEEERKMMRMMQDEVAKATEDFPEPASDVGIDGEDVEILNGVYRILKNNKIMGQVLRTKYGNLEHSKIQEIVEGISDSGLRLVNLFLQNEEEIIHFALYIKQKFPDWSLEKIKSGLEALSFLWSMAHIEMIVSEINVPEIRGAVESVVRKRSTPAFDLIGYFTQLDSATELLPSHRDALARLLNEHRDHFVHRVLSIRTQHFMNTHRSKAPISQSICKRLGIVYRPQRVVRDK